MNLLIRDGACIRTSLAPRAIGDVWFVHGFGESGLSFREAFASPLAQKYNLFVPDFPGFGAAPFNPSVARVQGASQWLMDRIREVSRKRPIFLVGHSLGGIIATQAAKVLLGQLRRYVSIEGNLIRADAFFSGKALKHRSPDRFSAELAREIFSRAKGREDLQRYHASLRFADPRALLAWGKTGACETGQDKAGREFLSLACRKLYFWSDDSTPAATQRFIYENNVPNKRFHRKGHWPMITSPRSCYEAMLKFFRD
ncbi:MAG: alpha/beta hydrolase [Elusimicrobia bacterium]|nr:alpha/beta hydrolase [Elusimicrobiota bacterium]